MVDAKTGITPDDMDLCRWLRRKKSDIILVANKCESNASESGILEAFNLGLGEPVVISAEHGLGMANLYAALRLKEQKLVEKGKNVPSHAETQNDIGKASADLDNFSAEKDREILRLAIVGRPNVGKSTLIKFLGYKKTLEFALRRKKMIIGKLKKYGIRSNKLVRTLNFILDRSY